MARKRTKVHRASSVVAKHKDSKVPFVLRDMIRCWRKRYEFNFIWKEQAWAKERPDEVAKANRIAELMHQYNFDVKRLCEDAAKCPEKFAVKFEKPKQDPLSEEHKPNNEESTMNDIKCYTCGQEVCVCENCKEID